MRIFSNISPTFYITRRVSRNPNIRYSFLVQKLQSQSYNNSLILSNLAIKRYYCDDKCKTSNGLIKPIDGDHLKARNLQHYKSTDQVKRSSSIFPIALMDLNPLSASSTNVLLIPLNWNDADEKIIRNTISSIFAKCKYLRQIEAFSDALREVPKFQEVSDKVPEKQNIFKNEEKTKSLQISQQKDSQEESFLESSEGSINEQSAKNLPSSVPEASNLSLIPLSGNKDYLDSLAAAVEKALQQCCLQSIQMYVDANLFGETIKGLQFYHTPKESGNSEGNEFINLTLSTKIKDISSIIKLDASKLNLEEISWNIKYTFPEIPSSLSSNIAFPVNMIRKSYSTRPSTTSQEKVRSPSISSIRDSAMLTTPPKRSTHSDVTTTTKQNASNSNTNSKCNANYDFPFLSKLFGAKELLMSCDAYNKALIDAGKRRAALAKSTSQSKNVKDPITYHHKVKFIPGCIKPTYKATSELTPKSAHPCQTPFKKASNGGFKKEEPCEPAKRPNPCIDKVEKLESHQDENAEATINKTNTGCVSPKCKTDDGCIKTKKNPCKKASVQQIEAKNNCLSTAQLTAVKEAKGGCKKDDPCKPTECPNPCKDEMERLKRQTDEEGKRNKGKMPTGCVSPKCKKDDDCTKPKKSPCKKASGTQSRRRSKSRQSSAFKLDCAKSKGDKDNSDSFAKEKGKDKKNPCLDEHKEYKPKCNKYPCKEDTKPCRGSSTEKKKPEQCYKNKNKPFDRCKKKGPEYFKSQKENSCKTGDPCKKQKNMDQDPCKNQQKINTCVGSNIVKDPCKNKNKKKEDPGCSKKKKDPSVSSIKTDNNSCKNKKNSPCTSKKQKDDPCKKNSSPSSPLNKTSGLSNKSQASKLPNKTQKKDTKPNCNKNKKYFSTLASDPTNISCIIKRTFTSLTFLPTLKNKNMCSFGLMRHFSSKGGKNSKNDNDEGKSSQCKSLKAIIPSKRKPAFNPHPKDGIRKCFPTYDMDCKKLCKDARKTDCKKYAFLNDTDNNKRKGKK